jgi:hypothetical protein
VSSTEWYIGSFPSQKNQNGQHTRPCSATFLVGPILEGGELFIRAAVANKPTRPFCKRCFHFAAVGADENNAPGFRRPAPQFGGFLENCEPAFEIFMLASALLQCEPLDDFAVIGVNTHAMVSSKKSRNRLRTSENL